MKIIFIVISTILLNSNIQAQKIDTDSLLVKKYELSTTKKYEKAIELAQLGIKRQPNYSIFISF
jgi:hypothetical protein